MTKLEELLRDIVERLLALEEDVKKLKKEVEQTKGKKKK